MGRAGSAGAGGMEAAGHRLPRELCCAHRRRLAKIAETTETACQLASAAHLRCISTCVARVFVCGGGAGEAGLATAAAFLCMRPDLRSAVPAILLAVVLCVR